MRFPEKLMNLIDDGQYADCIQWTDDGSAFEILDPVRTEQKLLKEVFNGTKMNSFVRKVYKWGFSVTSSCSTITRQDKAWKSFSHPLFQRGELNLCRLMKRDKKINISSTSSTFAPLLLQSNNKAPKSLSDNNAERYNIRHNTDPLIGSCPSHSQRPAQQVSSSSSSTFSQTDFSSSNPTEYINQDDVFELLQRLNS